MGEPDLNDPSARLEAELAEAKAELFNMGVQVRSLHNLLRAARTVLVDYRTHTDRLLEVLDRELKK